jgi:succinate dehydrogenase/fumarate reductase flavoprotein subunit
MGVHTLRTRHFDVLVIGGGAAGTRAAVAAAESGARTAMVLKTEVGRSGSTCFPAHGPHGSAYQAADGCSHADGDSPDRHFDDIMTAGLGMTDPRLARILADEAPDRLAELISWGFIPDPEPCGRDRPHWAGYSCFGSFPRAHGIWDVSAGHAGALVTAAASRLQALGVTVMPHTLVSDLLVQDGGCVGALALETDGDAFVLQAPSVILTCGGAGQLFPAATASREATGDGYAMALRAGAKLVNLEFMQFMARGLPDSGPVLWMLYPQVRNAHGEEVLGRYLPAGVDAEQACECRTLHYPFSSRDASGWLDIAIRSEAMAGRGIGPRAALTLNYDNPVSRARARDGKRPRPQHHWPGAPGPVPFPVQAAKVTHAAHAINGGVLISATGQSSIDGIYAAGETAAGAHGADRLGGNMLPNAQVFGRRAGQHAAERARGTQPDVRRATLSAPLDRLQRLQSRRGHRRAKKVKLALQEINARSLYVVRSEEGLIHHEHEISRLRHHVLPEIDTAQPAELWGAIEAENMLTVSHMMGAAACMRTESRGGHFRSDHPRRDEAWSEAIVQRWEDGQLRLRREKLDA